MRRDQFVGDLCRHIVVYAVKRAHRSCFLRFGEFFAARLRLDVFVHDLLRLYVYIVAHLLVVCGVGVAHHIICKRDEVFLFGLVVLVRLDVVRVVSFAAERLATHFECGVRIDAGGNFFCEKLLPSFFVSRAVNVEQRKLLRGVVGGRFFRCVKIEVEFAARTGLKKPDHARFRERVHIRLLVAELCYERVRLDLVMPRCER